MVASRDSVRTLARRLAALEQRVNGLNTPQLARASIEDGAIEEYDRDGNLVARWGKQEDGSHTITVFDGPTPHTPTAPIVEAGPGLISVRWDGVFLDESGQPDPYRIPTADQARIEAHVLPDAETLPEPGPQSSTRRATVESPGGAAAVVKLDPGTYWVRLVTVSLPGKYSAPSPATQVTVEAAVSEEELDEIRQTAEAAAQAGQQAAADAADAVAEAAAAYQEATQAKSTAGSVKALTDGWTKTGTVLIDGGQIAADTILAASIAAGQITADHLTANSVTAGKIAAGAIVSDKIAAGQITTGHLAASAITAEKIAANAVTANKIAAGQITAGHLAADTLKADNIKSGTLTADISIKTAGSLTIGEESEVHVKAENNSIKVYIPGALNPDGSRDAAREIITIGDGGAFTAFDTDGDELGGIREDGTMFTPHLDAGVVTVDGDNILDRFHAVAHGTVVWTGHQSGVGPYTTKTGVWEFGFDAVGGRRYRIEFMGMSRLQGDHTYAYMGLNKTQTEDFSQQAPVPTINSPGFPRPRFFRETQYSEHYNAWYFQPSRDERTRWLLWIDPGLQIADQWCLVVEDLGPSPDNTGRPSLGGASGSTPPSQPPVKDFTAEYGFTYDTHATWTQYGRVTQSAYKPHLLRQGMGGSSRYRAYLPLTSGAQSRITGADSISRIGLQLTAAADNWNVRPYIGLIATTSVKGSTEPQQYYVEAAKDANGNAVTFKPGERKWVYLSSSQIDALKGGVYKGIMIGSQTSNLTLISFYGTTAATANRPKIKIWGKE